MALRILEMALLEDTTREYYDAETGIGTGLYPFRGYRMLAYLMPLEFGLGFDPTNLHISVHLIKSKLLIMHFPVHISIMQVE